MYLPTRKKTYMRARRILNPRQIDYLFDHLLNGFAASREGILALRSKGIVTSVDEVIELLLKNEERLLQRIAEFKIAHKITSVLLACLFTFLQISTDDLQARRPGRMRRRNEIAYHQQPLI